MTKIIPESTEKGSTDNAETSQAFTILETLLIDALHINEALLSCLPMTTSCKKRTQMCL